MNRLGLDEWLRDDERWQQMHDSITHLVVQEFPAASGFYEHASDAATKIMRLLDSIRSSKASNR